MLTRNIRIEEDLVDQLFNSTEKRLARTLLLLARYGEPEASHGHSPRCRRNCWRRWWGPGRSRVNFFMNKFRKLGLHGLERRRVDRQLPLRACSSATEPHHLALNRRGRHGRVRVGPAAPPVCQT